MDKCERLYEKFIQHVNAMLCAFRKSNSQRINGDFFTVWVLLAHLCPPRMLRTTCVHSGETCRSEWYRFLQDVTCGLWTRYDCQANIHSISTCSKRNLRSKQLRRANFERRHEQGTDNDRTPITKRFWYAGLEFGCANHCSWTTGKERPLEITRKFLLQPFCRWWKIRANSSFSTRFGMSMDTRPLRNVTISTASCDIGIQFGSLVLEFVACFMYMFQGFPSKRRPVTPDSRMGFGVSATIGRSPMSKVEKVNGCRGEINLKIGRWELLPSMSIRFFNLYYVMLQSFTQDVGCFFSGILDWYFPLCHHLCLCWIQWWIGSKELRQKLRNWSRPEVNGSGSGICDGMVSRRGFNKGLHSIQRFHSVCNVEDALNGHHEDQELRNIELSILEKMEKKNV